MSKPNYWAESLGFDSQITAQTATQPSTPEPSTVAAAVDEAQALEDWLNNFVERTKQNEATMAQRATEQIRRDDEEVEKWKALRKKDEEERRKKEEELLRESERVFREELRKQQDQQEESRILSCTQGLSDAQRTAWVLEEQELLKLENDFNTRNQRLECLNAILKQSAAQYDMKIAFDEMVEATTVSADEYEAFKRQAYLEAEVNVFAAFAVDSRAPIEQDSEWEFKELKKHFIAQKRNISRQERAIAMQALDGVQRETLMARSEEVRDNILDEMVLLSNLSRTLKQQALTLTS